MRTETINLDDTSYEEVDKETGEIIQKGADEPKNDGQNTNNAPDF